MRDERRAFCIPLAAIIVALLMILGGMAAAATSGGRRTVAWMSSHQLIYLAAQSALDEAGAVLRNQVKVEPLSSAQASRDLKSVVAFPAAVDVPQTRLAFESQPIQISPVTFATGSWVIQRSSASSPNPLIREIAIVEMSVSISLKSGTQKEQRRTVSVRRYASAAPLESGFGIVVSPNDLTYHEEAQR